MIKVGLTGGIGSGKSTVCRFFALLGIPCYDSDAEAKRLMDTDAQLRERITELFGEQAYTSAGPLDRAYLASRVFGDALLLGALNAAVHPAVAADFVRWAERQKAPYVIEESAILFESGADKHVDRSVAVIAPEELRLERVCRRDGRSPEQVRARMAHQLSDEQRASRSDYVLRSDDRELLIPQILALHQTLLSL